MHELRATDTLVQGRQLVLVIGSCCKPNKGIHIKE